MTEMQEKPALYSKAMIVGFCMFLSPFFGGFMLRQNLIDLGKRKEGGMYLIISLLMSLFNTTVLQLAQGGMGLTAFLNLAQGAILCETAFRRYIPEEDSHPSKPIGKPLTMAVLLTLVLMFMLVLSGGLPEQPK